MGRVDAQRHVWALIHSAVTRDMEGHGALVEALDEHEAREAAGVLAFIVAGLMTAHCPSPDELPAFIRACLLDLARDAPPAAT